jgi:hypothetical protein
MDFIVGDILGAKCVADGDKDIVWERDEGVGGFLVLVRGVKIR